MNEQTNQIVKRVLSEAADAQHFFDLSDAQRLNWMTARAYEIGKVSSKPRPIRKASPNWSRGASLELLIQLRPQSKSVYSGRRK